jgi:two-component system, chemotaxis family, sensor kinase CheA
MEITDREVLEELLLESQEHLETIEPDLLALEENPSNVDKEVINRIFRGIHSIKGGFGFIGVTTVQGLAHVMESVLMKVRDGELSPTSGMIDTLLEGVDKIRDMLADVEQSDTVDASAVLDELQPWIDGVEAAPPPPPEPEPEPVAKPVSSGFIPLGKPKNKSLPKAAQLDEPEIKTIPTKAPVVPVAKKPADKPAAKKAKGADVLRVKVNLLNQLMNLAGELVLARNQIVQSLDRKLKDTTAGQAISQSTDIAIEETHQRLKNSLCEHRNKHGGASEDCNMMGDMIEREFLQLRERLHQAQPARLSDLPGMNASMVNLDGVTTSLQENIMQTRMQNMDTLFGKLPRQIRELSKKTGKEVYLEIEGKEVELDKSIVESLSDPLNHMIRNSLDHGLEGPAEREANGKSRSGRLTVRAYHEGGQVNIQIVDDGRGINPEIIKTKAFEKGVITAEQMEQMEDREAIMLIMAPGFSTAEQVSDISGRGVGMDVVRSNIENLGGSVDVESKVNEGTRMTLKLPLTLAIIPSLLVKVAERRFAVPQVSLDELVRLRHGDDRNKVENVQGKEVVRLRGKLLPLVRLDDQLGMKKPEENQVGEESGLNSVRQRLRATNILVLKHGDNRYGLVVDEVLDSEEIVVKPLPGMLKDSKSYAGATIMGDGTVAMIIDVVGIAEEAGLRFSDVETSNNKATKLANELEKAESQTLLMFRNHESERFAMNLDLVSRIEKIESADIEKIGDLEFLKYDTESLRLVRLQDYMPIKAPESEPEELYIIIPKLVRHPLGIVATACEDVITTKAQVDKDSLSGCGLIGSAVIEKELTVFLDVYSLFEAAEPEIYKGNPASASLDGMKILLAEDTSFFRAMIKKYIEELGYDIEVAVDGREAWDMLNAPNAKYDMLVTDIEMPHMDGLELTRMCRASSQFETLPIITLTSLSSEQVREEALEAGVNAHEIKFDKDVLAGSILKVGKEVIAHV